MLRGGDVLTRSTTEFLTVVPEIKNPAVGSGVLMQASEAYLFFLPTIFFSR